MTRLLLLLFGAFAAVRLPTSRQTLSPTPPDSVCAAQAGFVGPCYTVHGRMRWYNGAPGPRIWVIGTNRVLGVEDEELYGSCVFPKPLRALLTPDWRLDREVFAAFVVRPRTPYHHGWMQRVCVASARHIFSQKIP